VPRSLDLALQADSLFYKRDAGCRRSGYSWIGDAVIYGSGETPEKSVYKVNSSIPDDHWPNRRLRQYETGRVQTVPVGETKVQITIDRDCAHGLVAGSGEKKEEPACFAK